MTSDAIASAAPVAADNRIKCEICGAQVHSIQLHLRHDHADMEMTLAQYEEKFPGSPVLSAMAIAKLAEARAMKPKESVIAAFIEGGEGYETHLEPLHELFSLGTGKAGMNARGGPIPITVVKYTGGFSEMVPDIDPNYVYNLDVLKTLLMGFELRIPTYLWGHSGTGKTTIYEQIAARTGRAMLRVQHTANMEEEHVLGGWRLRDGKTIFELGPLPMAMINGWVYLADEYDFGRPEVLSVYQPVLEGKSLVIKEANLENRVIRPHPGFRFIATGNTNGQGDETGLYQGTTMQNAANYERFGIVEKMNYMEPSVEAVLVSKQAQIPLEDAKKLVDYANRIRGEFDSAKISNPISPRSLIYAGRIGMVKSNYLYGLEKSYINRLGSVDREAAAQLANRVFGKTGI
jgi:cobaltochelatase CobS